MLYPRHRATNLFLQTSFELHSRKRMDPLLRVCVYVCACVRAHVCVLKGEQREVPHSSNKHALTPVGCLIIQHNSDTLPENSIRFHRLRAQSHKTVPQSLYTPRLLLVLLPIWIQTRGDNDPVPLGKPILNPGC